MNRRTQMLAVVGAAVLAVPVGAMAHPGHGHAYGHGNSHPVSYVFTGTYGGAGLVSVNHGNAHARKAGLVGQDVQFDLSSTRLSVADTNGDAAIDATDVVVGDEVVVKSKLSRQDPGTQPLAARHLVDQTNPAQESGSDDPTDTDGGEDDPGDAGGVEL
jgi:hypothetical protein